MGTIEENLAINLRRLRENADLTLKELSDLSGIKIGTLNRWENKKQGFRLNNLKEVAAALKCKVEDLTREPVVASNLSDKADLLTRLYAVAPTLDESKLRGIVLAAERLAHGAAPDSTLVSDELKNKSK